MQSWWWMIACVLVAGCGDKKQDAPPPPVAKTYKLSTRADKEEPPGGVSVTITWPAGWKETEVKPLGPQVEFPGADIMEGSTLILRHCPDGTEGAACIDAWTSKLHDPAKTKHTPVGDRRWVDSKVGKLPVGSLFVYHPATKTVVECQTMVKEAHVAKLAEARAACERLTL